MVRIIYEITLILYFTRILPTTVYYYIKDFIFVFKLSLANYIIFQNYPNKNKR